MKRRSQCWLLATVALSVVFSSLEVEAAGRRQLRRARRAAARCQHCTTRVIYSTATVSSDVGCHVKAFEGPPGVPSELPLDKYPGASPMDDLDERLRPPPVPDDVQPLPAQEPSPSDLRGDEADAVRPSQPTPATRPLSPAPTSPPAPPAPPGDLDLDVPAEDDASDATSPPARPSLDSPFDDAEEAPAPPAENQDNDRFEDLFEGLPNEPAETNP